MAYTRTNWKDHVVERPRTYTEASNDDGSKTFTPAPKTVLQQGTPQSATNFNKIEEGLQHCSVALDQVITIVMAQAREITALQEKVAELAAE